MKARVTFTLLFGVIGAIGASLVLYLSGLALRYLAPILDSLVKIFSNSRRTFPPSFEIGGFFGSVFIITFAVVVLIAASYGYKYGQKVAYLKKYKDEHLNLVITTSIFLFLLFFTLGYGFLNSSLKIEEEQCEKIKDLGLIKGTKVVGIRDEVVDKDKDDTPDHLQITFSVESVCFGEFLLKAALYSKEGSFLRDIERSDPLKRGRNEVVFDLDLKTLPGILSPGSFSLKNISLSGSYFSPLTGRIEETKVENLAVYVLSAELYLKEGTNLLEVYRVIDYGLDSDGNGLFEDLVVEIEGRASADGEFITLFRLANGLFAKEKALTLNRGEVRLIFHIDGASLYSEKLDGPYLVKDLSFQSKANPAISFKEPSLLGYKTSAYNYKQFE